MKTENTENTDSPGVTDLPWLDRPDGEQAVARRLATGELDECEAAACRRWLAEGYLELKDVLDGAACEAINAYVDEFVTARKHLPHGELLPLLQDRFRDFEPIREAMCHPEVLRWADLLLGVRALPYQTLNLPLSSQQGAHSDEILMTTRPQGYLTAAWFALEDIAPDSGPLIVFPGSHRLPYVSAAELGIPRGAAAPACDEVYDRVYYERVRGEVTRRGLQHRVYTPRRGDVLFWHSNLLHGALPCERAGATRRSLIAHYFGEGAVHFSDLYDRSADLPGLRR